SLGHSMSANDLAADQWGEIFLFLFGSAERGDRMLHGPHLRVERKQEPMVLRAMSEPFHAKQSAEDIRLSSAVLARKRQSEDALRGALSPAFVRETSLTFTFGEAFV